ncbi:heme exporter protein CcmB [Arachidicoccus ginsenosidivorans]|uniref:Cytochrome C biogenesis protein n=1 Tax=Arachidicoccus ginsenosidivorans TaxID=496057 RepID=A0A5B8VPP3_9BACT|nr:heme exporter protein CcmB [Arachidicoccus ginsenosidivorans]QEC72646.1 cytochrome C biogenesis protein [Arachidicoccus ginsenosidivorans]
MNRYVISLIKKDLLLELRQQYTLYGIFLYVASTIFVIYITMGQPEEQVWNAMFWVVQLFVAVNAVAKSFLQESKGRMLYFYSIAGARDFVLSKIVFNGLLMMVMTLLSVGLFAVLLGNPVYNMAQFIGLAMLGGLGLSFTFTFLAAIAAKAQQQAALMAVMGFPIIVPQLLLLGKVSKIAFSPALFTGLLPFVGLLLAFDVLIIVLALILFPFLWKD